MGISRTLVLSVASFSSVLMGLSSPARSDGDDQPRPRVKHVDCSMGQSINRALQRGDDDRARAVVIIKGVCTENVVIERDDVTLQGEPGAAVVAANPAL